MSLYDVSIVVMAHCTGRGSSVDQMQAGAHNPKIRVKAEDIQGAINMASIFCGGIKQNPIVYETEIESVVKVVDSYSSTEPVIRVLTERGECYMK